MVQVIAERSSGAAAIASGTHTRVADSGNSTSGDGSLVAFCAIRAASAGRFARTPSIHFARDSLWPSNDSNIRDNLNGDLDGNLGGDLDGDLGSESLCHADTCGSSGGPRH